MEFRNSGDRADLPYASGRPMPDVFLPCRYPRCWIESGCSDRSIDLPPIRQQVVEIALGMCADALKDVAQVFEWIDAKTSTCCHDDGVGDTHGSEKGAQDWFSAGGALLERIRSAKEALYFEGCLPIEELARRGVDTLRFGPMKPVGLIDPRTNRRPHAVVQLRQENLMAGSYNLVGFQNHLRFPEQKRIFRLIPGLEHAEFLRFGQIHRNTYLQAPRLLDATLQTRKQFWVAECPSLPGCISQGRTREEAIENIREAIQGYIVSLEDDSLPVPPERFEAILVAV